MSFYFLCLVGMVATLLLALGWLFLGGAMIKRWGAQPTEIALVLGRRIGGIYLGLSLLYFLVRGSQSAEVVLAVSTVTVVVTAVLAGLGVFDYLRGRVGPAIIISVALELFLCVGFGRLALA